MLLFLILNTRKATAFLRGVVFQGVCYPGGQMQSALRSPRESPSERPAGRRTRLRMRISASLCSNEAPHVPATGTFLTR